MIAPIRNWIRENPGTIESMLPALGMLLAIASSLAIVWGLRSLRHYHPPIVINPNDAAAKQAARSFFEPPRNYPPPLQPPQLKKGAPPPPTTGAPMRPSKTIMPSALVRFHQELATKMAEARKNPGAAHQIMVQLASCVSQQAVLPAPERLKCLFSASELSGLYPRDPQIIEEFKRVRGSADPGILQQHDLYQREKAKRNPKSGHH